MLFAAISYVLAAWGFVEFINWVADDTFDRWTLYRGRAGALAFLVGLTGLGWLAAEAVR